MSGIRKRSKRNSGHGLHMRHAEGDLAAAFRLRKEKNVQLHDEADLVNFRADNIRRFAQNQELLLNVVLKLIHTARIKPPAVFPEALELYSEKSEEELEKLVLEALKSDLLVFSDVRLMRTKARMLEAGVLAEKAKKTDENVLFAEQEFQKDACDTLARLQSEHRFDVAGGDGLERMESALAAITDKCESAFKKKVLSSHSKYKRSSVAAKELDPKVEVKEAPEGYSAKERQRRNAQNDRNGNHEDDLGLEMGNGYAKEHGLFQGEAQNQDYDYGMKPEKNDVEGLNLGVNMDDLDQFLADPNHANSGMDDMDALMNFDQEMDTEHAANENIDENFGDFLNHMD